MNKDSKNYEYITHLRWTNIIILPLFLILLGRFFQLQILEGEKYEKLAKVSHIGKERIPPRRGLLKARHEEVISKNIDTYSLYAVPHFMKNVEEEIKKISKLLNLKKEEEEEIFFRIQKNISGSNRFNKVIIKKNLISTHCPMDATPLVFNSNSQTLLCPSCKNTYYDEKAIITSHLFELPGIYIETTLQRFYPMGSLLSHVTGYINEVNKKDIEKEPSFYQMGDTIGRAGAERAFEKFLRGEFGERFFVKDARGVRISPQFLPLHLKNLKEKNPKSGNNITLTIDLDLQNTAEEALRQFPSGAIVIVKVHTGEILALYSKPTFDPNKWSRGLSLKEKIEYDSNIYAPMLNKCLISYPPASTFKLITAIAGLEEGIITQKTDFQCRGFYEFKGRKFRCYHRSGHGKINLIDAIKFSCAVYFYKLGEIFGNDKIVKYALLFGLGEKTGIELFESKGRVPDTKWYMKHSKEGFQPGFALSTAIGQADVKTTPLQLARTFSAIVNGGKLLKMQLLLKVEDEEGNIIKKFEPEVERIINVNKDNLKILKSAMILSVNDKEGTAYNARIEELPFGGKTGTAEDRQVMKDVSDDIRAWLLTDHAWFVGFAPAHAPEIVVVVFIEHGGMGGRVAAPVAREIIKRYYSTHLENFEFFGLY